MAVRRHTVSLRVTEVGYTPSDEPGIQQHAKFKAGQTVSAEIGRGRSVQQHRLYWQILTAVVAYCPGRWRTPEMLHEVLKVATGHVEVVQLINGRLIKLPQSTSFDAMKQDQFQAYFDAVRHVIEDEILGGMGIEELLSHADGNRSSPVWEGANAAEEIAANGWGG